MELGGGAELVDGQVEAAKRVAQGVWQVVGGIDESGGSRAEDAQVDLGAEEGDAQAEAGAGVPLGTRDALDETVQTKASEVVGHRAA